MKVYSGEMPKVYDVSGQELRIHWDMKEVQSTGIDETVITQWECNEALCLVSDDRSTLIEKIIGSVYSTGAEIAVINNGGAAYDDYQQFRQLAKSLADEWLNKE